MSYAIRWLIEYKDINEVLTSINIIENGFMGTVVNVTPQDNPLTIRWGDDSDTAPILYGSTANIRFFAESNFQFIDLYTGDPRKFMVEVYKNGVLRWKGYAIPDQWSEPYIEPPYPVEFEATDGLAFLRDEPFTDDAGAEYTGMQSLLYVLLAIMSKTGLPFNYHTALNWHEITHDTGSDVLAQTYVDLSVFAGLSCGDVLEKIFLECRIYERDASWWFVSNSNFEKASFVYNKYNSAGVYLGQETCSNVISRWSTEGETTLEMKPALKHVVINQVYGLKDNLLENPKFDIILNELAAWSSVGSIPAVKPLDADGKKYIFVPGYQDVVTAENLTNCIYQWFPVKATRNNLRLRFRFAAMGQEDEYCYLFWSLRVVSGGTTYYAARKEGDTKETTEWKFVTSGELKNQPVAYQYDYRFSNVLKQRAWLEQNVTDKFAAFEAVIEDGFPVDGIMTLYFFVPKNGNPNVYGSCWTDISLEFMTDDKTILPTNHKYKVIRDNCNNEIPDDIELTFGDIPIELEPNLSRAYLGSLYNSSSEYTTAWKRDGDTNTYTYSELIGRMMAARMRRAQQCYRIKLNQIIAGTSQIIQDSYNSNRRFLESGITYNDRYNTIEGQYIEVITLDLATGITVDAVEEREQSRVVKTVESVKESTTDPIPLSVDRFVGIGDENTGEITGEPGIMADGYFLKMTIESVDFPVYVPNDIHVQGASFTGYLQGTYSKLSGALQKIDALQSIQGPTGSQGLTGAGVQGATGLQGVQGIQGRQGIQGLTGAGTQGTTGIQGATGSQGLTGAGIQGATGLQGATGTQGATGSQGLTGAGIQGPTGSQGLTGAGSQGTTGIQGATGSQGLTGAGVQGATGLQGVQGIQGRQGIQGLTGAGTQGTTGIQGATGSQGLTGAGIQGATGLQGATGTQGATGSQGLTGAGIQGPTGSQGLTGAGSQGTTGIQGATGSQGLTGAGVQGATGLQGVQGIQGRQGIQGIFGIQGVRGTDGKSAGMRYIYLTNTGNFRPGATYFATNNTTIANVTQIYIDYWDFYGERLDALLRTFDDSTSPIKGILYFNSLDNAKPGFGVFAVNSLVDNANYFVTLNVSFIAGSNLSVATDMAMLFTRSGDQGGAGIQGPQGIQGCQGIQGLTGAGTQGTTGIQGYTGIQGIQGTQGLQGRQGTIGIQGILGVQGLQGLQGIQGILGLQGLYGVQGLQGIKGDTFWSDGSGFIFRNGVVVAGKSTRDYSANSSNVELGSALYTTSAGKVYTPNLPDAVASMTKFVKIDPSTGEMGKSTDEFGVPLVLNSNFYSGATNYYDLNLSGGGSGTIWAKVEAWIDAGSAGPASSEIAYVSGLFVNGGFVFADVDVVAGYDGGPDIDIMLVDNGSTYTFKVRFGGLSLYTNYHYVLIITYLHGLT